LAFGTTTTENIINNLLESETTNGPENVKIQANKISNAILDQGEDCPSLYKKYLSHIVYKWEVGDKP